MRTMATRLSCQLSFLGLGLALTEWLRGVDDASVAPLIAGLQHTLAPR